LESEIDLVPNDYDEFIRLIGVDVETVRNLIQRRSKLKIQEIQYVYIQIQSPIKRDIRELTRQSVIEQSQFLDTRSLYAANRCAADDVYAVTPISRRIMSDSSQSTAGIKREELASFEKRLRFHDHLDSSRNGKGRIPTERPIEHVLGLCQTKDTPKNKGTAIRRGAMSCHILYPPLPPSHHSKI